VGLASTDFSEVSLRAIVKQDPQEEEENVLLGVMLQARCGLVSEDGYSNKRFKGRTF
jgi:hypothetical protein